MSENSDIARAELVKTVAELEEMFPLPWVEEQNKTNSVFWSVVGDEKEISAMPFYDGGEPELALCRLVNHLPFLEEGYAELEQRVKDLEHQLVIADYQMGMWRNRCEGITGALRGVLQAAGQKVE